MVRDFCLLHFVHVSDDLEEFYTFPSKNDLKSPELDKNGSKNVRAEKRVKESSETAGKPTYSRYVSIGKKKR